MSFVWRADEPLRTEEQVAREVHEVSLGRGLDELATVLALMCIRQESAFWCPCNAAEPTSENYPHDSESDDGRSVGYFQQQTGPNGELWWGPVAEEMDLQKSAEKFLGRLSDDYTTACDDAQAAGAFVQQVQRSAYPDAYAKHWDYCWGLLHRSIDGGVQEPPVQTPVKPVDIRPNPDWHGDPLYLPKLLEAFGVDVTTYTDGEGVPWDQRGHGDFDQISWVLWHHTGSVNETDEGIAHHPALGLAATMLVHPDGHTVLTGSGIAWHGGAGIYPGIPEDNINQISIGVECAYTWGPDEPHNPWPDAQVQAMVNIGGAISWFLGPTCPPDHQIAHKEWAGADNPLGINKQGKPDPANFDMDWFRQQIAQRAAAGPSADTGGNMASSQASMAIYRDDDDPIELETVIRQTNAMVYEHIVEALAILGEPESLAKVKRVAEGKAPVAVPDWAAERANTILKAAAK